MQLSKFNSWRRLWAISSVSYFIPVALITTYVAYSEGIAWSVVGAGILLFAAPVAFLYCLGLGVSSIYLDFVNRQA
jgi:vacuolar-type H+-ATPase subunit I/STV1